MDLKKVIQNVQQQQSSQTNSSVNQNKIFESNKVPLPKERISQESVAKETLKEVIPRDACEVVSSFEHFCSLFPKLVAKENNSSKLINIKNYFSNKGIISIKKPFPINSWPEVVYPDAMRLQKQIDLLHLKIDSLSEKKLGWRKHVNETNLNELKVFFGKYVDKTYWKHFAKILSDKDYKQDSESVKLPVNLIGNPKVKPMIEKFVNDAQYRRQLTETVSNSIVYKDKQIGSHHAKTKDFRLSIGRGQLIEISAQIKEIQKEIDALEGIQKLVAGKF